MTWNARQTPRSPQQDAGRSDGDIDYAHVVHSASFRRLQGKTQILNLGDSDFYRTRLTHSLEVAQIAGGVTTQLAYSFPHHPATKILPDRSTIQAISCAHDLGHPPFGHGGEIALNYAMRDQNGFEGNGQTLRILSRLESFSVNNGANLTRRTLLGILKYPAAYLDVRNPDLVPKLLDGPSAIKIIDVRSSKPPKCYLNSEQDVVDWILEPLSTSDRYQFQKIEKVQGDHSLPKHKSLDSSIMDAADDIAYGIHDLDDAIALNLITKERFSTFIFNKCAPFINTLKKHRSMENPDGFAQMVNGLFGDSVQRKKFIGLLVHHFVNAIEYYDYGEFEEPLIRYRAKIKPPQRLFLDALQQLVSAEVIESPNVQQLQFKGQGMIVAVFEATQANPARLLPHDALMRFRASNHEPRVICDYVAGMTDAYLCKTFERLFSPRIGSVFDRL